MKYFNYMNMIKKKWIGITVTEAAEKYFYNLLHSNTFTIGIQIHIKKSGCAGFRYHLSLISKHNMIHENDFYIYKKNNIKIYIPIKNMLLMDKTKIDFVTTDGINMNITFNNPNIDVYCGCGESFNIENKKIK